MHLIIAFKLFIIFHIHSSRFPNKFFILVFDCILICWIDECTELEWFVFFLSLDLHVKSSENLLF